MFRKKHVPFHTAVGASGRPSRHMPDVHADRVTSVNYTSYAVRSIPARCRTQTPVAPAAAWDVIYLPAGGEIPRRVNDRVTRVNYTSYAVSSKPGGCLDERPDSPPAGRKKPSLFHKKFALCV